MIFQILQAFLLQLLPFKAETQLICLTFISTTIKLDG